MSGALKALGPGFKSHDLVKGTPAFKVTYDPKSVTVAQLLAAMKESGEPIQPVS